MGATFCAYVDESGDEGFAFKSGSSEWFALAAVILRKATELHTVKLVDEVRELLGWPATKVLHFRDLKHEQRLPFVQRIVAADLTVVCVLVHKPSIREPEKFCADHRLYFYATRLLLERVSWYCRDNRHNFDDGDGTVEVVFSNRSTMSYEQLKSYLNLLRTRSSENSGGIDWSVITESQIRAFGSGRRMGLQIADAAAYSLFRAVERDKFGFAECRYARMLNSRVYSRGDRQIGYGLKIWPPEGLECLAVGTGGEEGLTSFYK